MVFVMYVDKFILVPWTKARATSIITSVILKKNYKQPEQFGSKKFLVPPVHIEMVAAPNCSCSSELHVIPEDPRKSSFPKCIKCSSQMGSVSGTLEHSSLDTNP